MNRLSRIVLLLAVVLGAVILMTAPPALANPIGGVIIIPGTGTDLDPIRLRTSAGCPTQTSAYYATMRGHGLPPDGQIITSPIKAGLSHSIGFDVYMALTMHDYADENHTALTGRYDITIYCINRLTQENYGEFTGSLEFTSPTTYQAIGAAKSVGPPSPPRGLAADGSALDLGQASSPTAPVPRVDSQSPLPTEQLSSNRNDVTVPSGRWLVLVVVCAVLVAVVAIAFWEQMRRHRSS
jgi:hypothetical protein